MRKSDDRQLMFALSIKKKIGLPLMAMMRWLNKVGDGAWLIGTALFRCRRRNDFLVGRLKGVKWMISR